MRLSRKKARMLLASLIFCLFFLPAYKNVSGLTFISMAFAEAGEHHDFSQGEAVMVTALLLAFPLSALVILYCALFRIRLRKLYLGFPLAVLISFFALILVTESGSTGPFSDPMILLRMQPAFYLALTGAVLLLFTRRPARGRSRAGRSSAVATSA